jgi:hypothetical protein
MAHAKPILAVSSIGLGALLVLTAIHIQRDRFAFTSQEPRNFDVPTSVTLVAPSRPATPPAAAPVEQIPTVEVEALQVLPEKPTPRRSPKRVTPTQEVQPAQPPCHPQWRELESGPAGGRVREICNPGSPDDVPRS